MSLGYYVTIPKKHFYETIQSIRKSLRDLEKEIKKKGNTQHNYHMAKYQLSQNLLCRVGELEVCVDYMLELKHNQDTKQDKKVEYKDNRLCTCYDRSN